MEIESVALFCFGVCLFLHVILVLYFCHFSTVNCKGSFCVIAQSNSCIS